MEVNEFGDFDGGLVLNLDNLSTHSISKHPDNEKDLKGHIPMWEEIKKVANKVTEILPQLTYLGFDFCITNKNEVKILEINSLSSLYAVQSMRSIFETEGGQFFKERLHNGK